MTESSSSQSPKGKRNLPSWMSSKDSESKSCKKKQVDADEEVIKHVLGSGSTRQSETSQNSLDFSKLLEGVVFVLSGFVNPERATLRAQALEMGAEYRPDWTSDCTLLVCAFPNTPKFRQVESVCGTIVSKEWISECYRQKRLVDIERYLMSAGKPWRKHSKALATKQDQKNVLSEEPQKQVGRSNRKLSESTPLKGGVANTFKDRFSPSKIKEWAIDDLSKTISWLESQEEKPERDQVRTIAAEGIMTCLQDAIESLRKKHDVHHVIEQWMFVPQVVKELADLEGRSKKGFPSKEELSELAIACKDIYERLYDHLDNSPIGIKKQKTDKDDKDIKDTQIKSDDGGYDSDQTVEMTEEEIDLACKQLPEYCDL